MSFFIGSPWVVELEKDLSIRKQLLDVVILRKGEGPFTEQLPDGLDDLGTHNLLTFKSHQEALDDWALMELTGHYVNYRKQVSTPRGPLLPEENFRLYAVCSRFPHNLNAVVPLAKRQDGVYNCCRGTNTIRVVIAPELSRMPHNAPLHLFSASPERVVYGLGHYRKRSDETSSLLDCLFKGYSREGLTMSYTLEDFKRDYIKEELPELPPEELQQVLARLPPEQRLAGLSVEEIENYLQSLRKASARPAEPKPAPRKRRKPSGD